MCPAGRPGQWDVPPSSLSPSSVRPLRSLSLASVLPLAPLSLPRSLLRRSLGRALSLVVSIHFAFRLTAPDSEKRINT